jgi:hypothetical protein
MFGTPLSVLFVITVIRYLILRVFGWVFFRVLFCCFSCFVNIFPSSADEVSAVHTFLRQNYVEMDKKRHADVQYDNIIVYQSIGLTKRKGRVSPFVCDWHFVAVYFV